MNSLLLQLSDVTEWVAKYKSYLIVGAIIIVLLIIIMVSYTAGRKKQAKKDAKRAAKEAKKAEKAALKEQKEAEKEQAAREAEPVQDLEDEKTDAPAVQNVEFTDVAADNSEPAQEVESTEAVTAEPEEAQESVPAEEPDAKAAKEDKAATIKEEKKAESKPAEKITTKQKPAEQPEAEEKETNMEESKKTATEEKESKGESTRAPSSVKTYHISKRKDDNKWAVKAAGASKAIKLFLTQAEAIEFAKKLAENQDANIMIHKEDGSFRRLTYKK